jgi:DNA-directed RNA polymerase subunit H (RpoH/RPB5)
MEAEKRALTTIKRMLNDTGVQGEYEAVSAPLEETRMFMFGPVLIVISDKTRVTERELSKILEYAETNDMKGGIIIVSPSVPSELVINAVCRYIANPDNQLVQIFEIRHLGFDIAEHRFNSYVDTNGKKVCTHKILVKEELDSFLKEFGLTQETTHLLPKIWCQDPMAKRIRARPGDVIEVKGLSLTAGEYRRARLCVEHI